MPKSTTVHTLLGQKNVFVNFDRPVRNAGYKTVKVVILWLTHIKQS